MNKGIGEAWLITFTRKLREMLPDHIITHAPQAPYFCCDCYKNQAYCKVDKEVGHMIDFYNVQFYNQGTTNKYDTYETLFEKSGGYFKGTSVNEIILKGIPAEKIVLGKPASRIDASNTGFMESKDLGETVL
eukprot:GHVR01055348.1.p1 GENE.GHVR01055348.1~~GHVR01055348.1.p1  ORF type:complete len:132 (+),score=9.95 GHVR01055348.1:1497-1892(+)